MHDVKNDLVDVINQIIKENSRASINNSGYSSEAFNKNGHLLITIKFFKFTDSNEDDLNQELRVIIIIIIIFLTIYNLLKLLFLEFIKNIHT